MSSYRHIPYHLHIGRVAFASLAVVAIALLHLPSLSPVQSIQQTTQHAAVLAYATNINPGDLAAGNNNARAQNGFGGMTLNSQLSTSAQLKANDMIAQNYWAHVSPGGTQPWYWFAQAGYDYVGAGENLAYGFSTSDAVTAGWMNSPGHKANILGAYQDVGYGIANGENFQGSQNTVVVAHYGKPRTPAPAPAPAPVAAAPTAPAAPSATLPSSSSASQPAPESPAPSPAPAPAAAPAREETPSAQPESALQPIKPQEVVTPTASVGMPVWKQLLSGTAPVIVLASMAILTVVSIGYVLTHVSLVRHAARLSEQYVMHHPFIDASVAVGASIIVLVTTIGHVG